MTGCTRRSGRSCSSRPRPTAWSVRGACCAFAGATTLDQLRRTPAQLVEFLFREASFPAGCFLMTGTGVVPPADVSLTPGDEVAITIDPIGTLTNRVA